MKVQSTRPIWRWFLIRGKSGTIPTRDRGPRVNHEIRARVLRVIGPDGDQLGLLSPEEALRVAADYNLDLVEISPNADPPVCKIMDLGKYKYEQSKRDRDSRKKQKVITVKELRMRPKIDAHDFEVKSKSARKFLIDGDKVKVSVRFRGREIVHHDLAQKKLQEMAEGLAEVGTVERQPTMEGRQMIMILAPHKAV